MLHFLLKSPLEVSPMGQMTKHMHLVSSSKQLLGRGSDCDCNLNLNWMLRSKVVAVSSSRSSQQGIHPEYSLGVIDCFDWECKRMCCLSCMRHWRSLPVFTSLPEPCFQNLVCEGPDSMSCSKFYYCRQLQYFLWTFNLRMVRKRSPSYRQWM